MESNESKCRSIVVVAFLATLPLLYILSAGPAIVLRNKGGMDADTFLLVYAPVILIYDAVPPFQIAFDWYLHWWAM
jgi:hypothetical protein